MRNIAVERQRLAGREIIAVAADCDREASFQDLQQLAGAVAVHLTVVLLTRRGWWFLGSVARYQRLSALALR